MLKNPNLEQQIYISILDLSKLCLVYEVVFLC